MFVRPILSVLFLGAPAVAFAEIGPPMFDISRQCDVLHHKNATAMSECVVAESEARAILLQNWSKYPETNAQRCVTVSRKTAKMPYTALTKCLSGSTAAASSKVPAK